MATSSLFADPDRRYWRRRANRRVRKARLTRSLLRWGVILVVDGLIAAALLSAAGALAQRLASTEALALSRIEVAGVERGDGGRIAALVEPLRGRNLLALRLDEVVTRVGRDPWVRSATAKRVLPGTVRIQVDERIPAVVADIDGVPHVVDTEGHVVGPAAPAERRRLPVLIGLTRGDDTRLIATLRDGVELVAELRRAAGPWVEGVAAIDLSRPDRITLHTRDPGPEIWIGRRSGAVNVESFLELRHEIERRAGALARVDLRWRDRITVTPASQSPATEYR